MDTSTIMASIDEWKLIHKNGAKLVSYLSQGNCFMYNLPANSHGSANIHVYPGIHEEQLLFFVIPEEYDNEAYSATIDQYVEVCPVMWTLSSSHRITASVAKARIKLWEDHYTTWVPTQAASPDGIFLAFEVARQDFESASSEVILALRLKIERGIGYQADLIIANPDGSKMHYDDFVKPVPPYSATLTPSSFYLLQV